MFVLREERSKALFPERDGHTHFIHVAESVVDRGDAGDRAGAVVKHSLNDVRRDAERRKIGGKRSAEVVQRPWCYRSRQPPIEGCLCFAPSIEGRYGFSASAKEERVLRTDRRQ